MVLSMSSFPPPVSIYKEMVWTLRKKNLKKPVILVGAACTSVLVGVFVFNKFLPRKSVVSSYCASCINVSSYPAYIALQKHQATKTFTDSTVKRLDVVYLGSNAPIEDRFVVGVSESLGSAFFSVLDGHKGTHCSQYLQDNMLQFISGHLHGQAKSRSGDMKVVFDMDTAERERGRDDISSVVSGEHRDNKGSSKVVEEIKNGLQQAFIALDNKISEAALTDVKAIMSGRSMNFEMKSRIMTALEGACAITAMVQSEDIIVANTGDCRVVLGQRTKAGEWKATPLSVDQNVHNLAEVERLRTSHPGEEKSVILYGRVLGSLMPFRTFGDVDYKWEKQYLDKLVPILAEYKSPPYVTAEPVITHHQRRERDEFIILASDGLWERLSSEDAVRIVGNSISCARKSSGRSGGRHCDENNMATNLLWHALGGNEVDVTRLLNISPPASRMYRDDITILVVYL